MPAMILYNCSDNRKNLNKTLTGGTQIETVKPYEPVSDLDGYVILDYNADYMNYNYAAYLNQFYFIEDRELLPGGKIKLKLHMDVLMSFQTDIRNCPAIAARSTIGNPYINDSMVPTQSYKLVKTYGFGDGGFTYWSPISGGAWNVVYLAVTAG